MEPVRIIGDIIFSVKYARTKKDFFTEVFQDWGNPEYIHSYVNKHKHLIESNLYFHGYTLQEIKIAIADEVLKLRTTFYQLIDNSRKGIPPGLEDRFYVLSENKETPDVRRKMYGHEKVSNMMVSVLRLYAIRLPSRSPRILPAYVIIGGAIKFWDNMQQKKETNLILNRFDSVLNWLKREKISTKEDLIQYIKDHEQHND